jgi:ring-1,2-phenylacetyl-CoA epoxidase subunit PaaE
MMDVVSAELKEGGVPDAKIRYELFSGTQQGQAKQTVRRTSSQSGVAARVTLNGETRAFQMSADTSLLDAAIGQSMDAPFACRAGVCSTCRAKVLEGDVEMRTNHALEDYEVERGFVLTCQCYPVSDSVIWDFDQALH